MTGVTSAWIGARWSRGAPSSRQRARVPEAQVNAATIEKKIRDRLAARAPEALALLDESALHVGHAEATGGGHYRLKIISAQVAGQSRVARHRMVYAMLDPLMRHHIHALALVAQAPGESLRARM